MTIIIDKNNQGFCRLERRSPSSPPFSRQTLAKRLEAVDAADAVIDTAEVEAEARRLMLEEQLRFLAQEIEGTLVIAALEGDDEAQKAAHKRVLDALGPRWTGARTT